MKTVLFIDDDPLPTKLYVRALEESGFRVVQKNSVDDALKFARGKQPVDIIIIDLMMPPGESFKDEPTHEGVTTGFFLRREMRKLYPSQPIVLLTNINNPEILQSDEGEGAVRPLHKFTHPPFDLADKVKELLEKQ